MDFQHRMMSRLLSLPTEKILKLAGGHADSRQGRTLDPQLQLVLRLSRLFPRLESVPAFLSRKLYRQFMKPLTSSKALKELKFNFEDLPLKLSDQLDIKVRHYYPEEAGEQVLPGVVFYHGGGWVIGDLDTHHSFCAFLASKAQCRVFAVDYRLAPKHQFPAAVEDAYHAFQELHKNASDYNIDPSRLAVAGDSAGGNLATVVCLLAKQKNEALPYCQVLIYPVTDLTQERPSYEAFGEGGGLTRGLMRWFIRHYCCDDEKKRDFRASPILASDLSGLPPAIVTTAGFDPLHDEGEAYALAMEKADVSVTYKTYPDLAHGYITMTSGIKRVQQALNETAQLVKKRLHSTS